ncbi:MAG: shikimate kinase [Desulfobacterales bacterium]
MPPFDHVVLIGMPAAGKSTVGVLLAKRLNFSFLDTDLVIQRREGKSLQELIRAHGLEGFCRLEERHVLSLSFAGCVVAPGGSVIYREAAMRHLKEGGIAVYLALALGRLRERLADLDARGVVIAPGRRLEDLYAERDPLYRRAADLVVATDGLTPDQVVSRVLAALGTASSPP